MAFDGRGGKPMIDEWGALLPGQRVAGYEIRRKLGQGGFGIAYEAINEDLGVKAAVKEFFPRELVGRSGSAVTVREGEYRDFYARFLNRFVEEARTLHKLDHPNIVKVRHFERANNTAYVVMDFIDGANLRAWLDAQPGPLTEAQLRRIFAPVMDALTYVHGENVLHRDLSPLNIMVDRAGKPWLIDFGAFKSMWKDQPRRTTVLAANPSYAPPEQVDEMSGQEHGPFTDVYALAATMYEAVSGRRPVSAISRTTALAYGRPDPLTPLAELQTNGMSDAVKRAIMNGLTVDPMKRTPTVAALKADAGWEQTSAGGDTEARASRGKWKEAQSDDREILRPDDNAQVASLTGTGKQPDRKGEPADVVAHRGNVWPALVWLVLAPLSTYLLAVLSTFLGPGEEFAAAGLAAGSVASVAAAMVLSRWRRPGRTSIEAAIYWIGSSALVGFFLGPVLHFTNAVKFPSAFVVGLIAFLAGSASYLVYRTQSGSSEVLPPHDIALDASLTGSTGRSATGAGWWVGLAWLGLASIGTTLLASLFDAVKWKIVDTLEGGIATGMILGSIASVAAAVGLVRLRRPSRTSLELGIYWLGSAAMVGFLLWPVLDIMRIIRHPASIVFGFAAFLIGGGAYFVYRNRL